MYLIDTNSLILGITGKSPDAEFLARAIENNALSLSVITVAEEKLIQNFSVFVVDEQTARVAAYYRKQSLKTARVHLLDCFLAAQAKQHSAILVTNNRQDFPMRDIKIISP